MAIYSLEMKIISRSKGQSAVAAAAYRSGERLEDERTGEKKFYKRDVQPDNMILAPSHAPEWVHDRNRLWNEVEKAEKRKDSQLAKEIRIAIPRELPNEQQKELVKNFAQNEFVNKGMIADIAIHRDDNNNPHAHIMLTTRDISEDGFGKKNRDWNADFANTKSNNRGFVKSNENCVDIREQWATYANQTLEKAQVNERISHLSHKARGLEQQPTIHLGHVAHEMEKRGVQTDRGNINRERQEYNRIVVDLQKYREQKQALEQEKARQQEQKKSAEKFTAAERVDLQKASKILKAEPSLKNIENRLEQLDKWEKRNDNNSQYLRWKDEKIKEVSNYYHEIQLADLRIENAQNEINKFSRLSLLRSENREKKQNLEVNIATDIKLKGNYQNKIDSYREKLKFNNEQEFNRIKKQYEVDRPGLLEKNRNIRQRIHLERDTLQKAEMAHKNAFVRQVANKYPEYPEALYMSYETAKKIDQVNKSNNRVVPIEIIEKHVNQRRAEIQKLHGELDRFQTMQKESFLDKNSLIESKFFQIEKQIESKESGLGILEGIINGLEQANRAMQQRERNRQQLQKTKGKKRSGPSLEM